VRSGKGLLEEFCGKSIREWKARGGEGAELLVADLKVVWISVWRVCRVEFID
jgi:hypothetical protein